MFVPISIDKFVEHHLEANPGTDADIIRAALERAIQAKKDGAVCGQCGGPMWVAGSAVAERNGCFTCITGEADSSDDFEIDSVAV